MRRLLVAAAASYAVVAVATAVLWGTEDVLAADPKPDIAFVLAGLAGAAAIALTLLLLERVRSHADSAAPTGVRHVGALRVLAMIATVVAGPLALAILLLSALGFGAGDLRDAR